MYCSSSLQVSSLLVPNCKVKRLLSALVLVSAIITYIFFFVLSPCISSVTHLKVLVQNNITLSSSLEVKKSWGRQASLNASLPINTSLNSSQTVVSMPMPQQSLVSVDEYTSTAQESEGNVTIAMTVFASHVAEYRSWAKGVITQISPLVQHNCSKLMAGDEAELKKVSKIRSAKKQTLENFNLSSCRHIREEFYNNFYVSEVERMFPIAFTLVVHKNAQQTVRFLKAIYRPHNLYCIHPDPNSGEDFREVFKLLSQCLGNVFLPAHIHNVTYDTQSTIFEAQLSCLRELEKRPSKWYYVINLCSRELPLKTNRFIVESLRALNGTSIVRPHPVDKHTLLERFPKMNITSSEQGPNFKFYKSLAYNALSYALVQFILRNSTIQELLQWMSENVRIPEEHFYATVYMMPETPGGFYSLKSSYRRNDLPLVLKVIWKHVRSSPYYKPDEQCASKYHLHEICILTSADLPQIKRVMEWNVWFFNKYFMEDDHVVMDCVEEVLVRNNKQEFTRDYPDSLR